MTRVIVTIEGDIDEVVAALRGIAGLSVLSGAHSVLAAQADACSESHVHSEDAHPSGASTDPGEQMARPIWNASYVHTFWRNLSDTARQAMIRVSRSPNHTQKRAQLMHTLHLSQRELSGSLSSQGHSLNRLKKRRGDVDLPRPLTYNKVNDAYILDPDFAEALRETGLS